MVLRTQGIALLVREITASLRDVEKNREYLAGIIDVANVMLLPWAWIGIDSASRLHVTYVPRGGNRPVPIGLHYSADFIWRIDARTNSITCVKSRFGQHHGETHPLDLAAARFLDGFVEDKA